MLSKLLNVLRVWSESIKVWTLTLFFFLCHDCRSDISSPLSHINSYKLATHGQSDETPHIFLPGFRVLLFIAFQKAGSKGREWMLVDRWISQVAACPSRYVLEGEDSSCPGLPRSLGQVRGPGPYIIAQIAGLKDGDGSICSYLQAVQCTRKWIKA